MTTATEAFSEIGLSRFDDKQALTFGTTDFLSSRRAGNTKLAPALRTGNLNLVGSFRALTGEKAFLQLLLYRREVLIRPGIGFAPPRQERSVLDGKVDL